MSKQLMVGNQLGKMSSAAAATFLMEKFPLDDPNYGEAFKVMAHRSWKRPDQIRLARFYLRKMPFATAKPYEVFASFMALPILISIVKEVLSAKPDDRQFVAYHVTPVLKNNVKSEADRSIVDQFLNELNASDAQPDMMTMRHTF